MEKMHDSDYREKTFDGRDLDWRRPTAHHLRDWRRHHLNCQIGYSHQEEEKGHTQGERKTNCFPGSRMTNRSRIFNKT